jgi:opacity protein-like surface antigen
MKTIHFFMATLIAVATATAQDSAPVKFGIRGGLNLGKIGIMDNSDESGRDYYYSRTTDKMSLSGNLIGFHVGVAADVKLLEFLYFQPGVMLNLKGGEIKDEYEYRSSYEHDYNESTITIAVYYLDVPLMLSLKGTLNNDLALRAHAGPYFGLGLFGKFEVEETGSSGRRDGIKIDNVFSPSALDKSRYGFTGANKFNFGVGLGAGLEFNNMYLGASYNIGLTNLLDSDELPELYERTVSVTIGYNF